MDLLREGAKDLGLTLSPRHLAAFELYYRELASWNERFNLTTIVGYEEVQARHFLDSLSCLLALPQEVQAESIPDMVPLQWGARPLWYLDVGSGAGFPGLPVKIMLPEAKVTLVEATGKKVTFLRHMVEVLGLKDVEVLHARAEDVGQMPAHREHYDLVLARAVASMCVLAEYCLPLCHVGGRMVAQKGEDAVAEASSAQQAYELLGGKLVGTKHVALPGLVTNHFLVVVDKVAKTPDDYPRRVGLPSKKPLC
jgi:16S rRNA (guanine527-N7)-methyltransferase